MAKASEQMGGYFRPEVEERRERFYAMVEREAERDARRARARKAARALRKAGGDQPGYDGRRALMADSVVSPFDGLRRESVVRNARHDPVEHLYQQRDRKGRRLIDEPERMAGIEIRRMVEALGLDAIRAIAMDERVDGGGRYYDIGARRYEAGQRAEALRKALGDESYKLLVRVAGFGEGIVLVAIDYEREDGDDDEGAINGACSARMRDRVGYMFRRALRAAAVHFGYRPAPRASRIVGFAVDGARPTLDGA